MLDLIEYAYPCKHPTFTYKNNSLHYIEKYKSEIIEKYYAIDKQSNADFAKSLNDYGKELNHFEAKICYKCSGKLILNKEWGFWGCSNYRTLGCKNTYNAKEPIIRQKYVTTHKRWVTDIIEYIGMVGKIKPKSLYDWFMSNNYEDLKEKYGSGSISKSYTGYIKAKANSYSQEQNALKYFKKIFDKVTYQQCIRYKLKGGKEYICIPDFICSNQKYIKVIDCKLSGYDIVDEKMDLYVALVKYIAINNFDFRPVTGAFCIPQSSYSHKSNYDIITIKWDFNASE